MESKSCILALLITKNFILTKGIKSVYVQCNTC